MIRTATILSVACMTAFAWALMLDRSWLSYEVTVPEESTTVWFSEMCKPEEESDPDHCTLRVSFLLSSGEGRAWVIHPSSEGTLSDIRWDFGWFSLVPNSRQWWPRTSPSKLALGLALLCAAVLSLACISPMIERVLRK